MAVVPWLAIVFISHYLFRIISSRALPLTTQCPLPPCQDPCGPYHHGAFSCKEGKDVWCQGYADCDGCYAKYYLNGVETICTPQAGGPSFGTTKTVTTTSCPLPPCVNPCGAFDSAQMNGHTIYCKGYPNTICQGYADCDGCYALYYNANTGQQIIGCELIYAAKSTRTAVIDDVHIATTNVDVTETTEFELTTDQTIDECQIDCADPCPMSQCTMHPNAHCDYTVDCDTGCTAFYKDDDGNIVDCGRDDDDDALTTETPNSLSNLQGTAYANAFQVLPSFVLLCFYCNFII